MRRDSFGQDEILRKHRPCIDLATRSSTTRTRALSPQVNGNEEKCVAFDYVWWEDVNGNFSPTDNKQRVGDELTSRYDLPWTSSPPTRAQQIVLMNPDRHERDSCPLTDWCVFLLLVLLLTTNRLSKTTWWDDNNKISKKICKQNSITCQTCQSSWGMRMGKWKWEGKGDFSSVPLNMNTITIHHQVTGWLVYRISRGCGGGGEFILRWEWIVGGFVYLALLLHSTDPEEVTGIRFNISFRILHWPSVLWDAMRLLS